MADYIQRDDYEEIVVAENETFAKVLSDGETYEHKLIDITNAGATVHLRTQDASNWTLRNIGIRGEHPGEYNVLNASVPDANGTGLVEHVYFGDGVAGDNGAFWVHRYPEHRGDLTYRRVHVGQSPNRGLDARMPGAQGDPGTITIEDSYFYSNNIANVRVGTAAATTPIRNTVIHVTDDVRAHPTSGTVDAVGVEARHGTVELDGVDIDTGGYGTPIVADDSTGGSVIQTDVRTGSAADTTPPVGVPLDPVAAASGSATAGTPQTAPDAWVLTAPDGSDITIPLYQPDEVTTPAFRLGVPTDTRYTAAAVPEFTPAADRATHALRVATPDGVYAVSSATATLLEDFEHGTWPGDWEDETDGFALTQTAINGAYSLEMVGVPDYPQAVNPNQGTPRGYDYSALFQLDGTDSRPGLVTNANRTDAVFSQGSFYLTQLTPAETELQLVVYTNGSRSQLATAQYSTLSNHTTYQLGTRVHTDGVQGVLKASDGTVLAETPFVGNTDRWGGHIGWYVGGSDPYGTTVDDFRQHTPGSL